MSKITASNKKGRENFCVIRQMLDGHEVQGETLEKVIKSNWQITVTFILNAKADGMFFNEILAESGLTARTLSSILKSLEAEKMLSRNVVDSRPVRVRYTLTGIGKKLASSGCPLIALGVQG